MMALKEIAIEVAKIGVEIAEEVWETIRPGLPKSIQILGDFVFKKLKEWLDPEGGLTNAEKIKIKDETGWPSVIIDAIGLMEEYKIYRDAGLKPEEVGGKVALVRTDINWKQKDGFGKTNIERVDKGLTPLDTTGKPIELHHIGQRVDAPLAELTHDEHRAQGNDRILHGKDGPSEVHGEGNRWNSERQEYWRNRLPENMGGNI